MLLYQVPNADEKITVFVAYFTALIVRTHSFNDTVSGVASLSTNTFCCFANSLYCFANPSFGCDLLHESAASKPQRAYAAVGIAHEVRVYISTDATSCGNHCPGLDPFQHTSASFAFKTTAHVETCAFLFPLFPFRIILSHCYEAAAAFSIDCL